MNKFWKWMEEKKYGVTTEHHKRNYLLENYRDNGEWVIPNKQMLIGYMMEYLDEVTELNSQWNGNPNYASSTEERYNWLESKINELSRPGRRE